MGPVTDLARLVTTLALALPFLTRIRAASSASLRVIFRDAGGALIDLYFNAGMRSILCMIESLVKEVQLIKA